MSLSPSQVAAKMYMHGLGDLGEYVKRRLQALEYAQKMCMQQEQQIKELESLLPDDVRERRRQEQEEYAAALRNGGGGLRRAPAESDG